MHQSRYFLLDFCKSSCIVMLAAYVLKLQPSVCYSTMLCNFSTAEVSNAYATGSICVLLVIYR